MLVFCRCDAKPAPGGKPISFQNPRDPHFCVASSVVILTQATVAQARGTGMVRNGAPSLIVRGSMNCRRALVVVTVIDLDIYLSLLGLKHKSGSKMPRGPTQARLTPCEQKWQSMLAQRNCRRLRALSRLDRSVLSRLDRTGNR